MILFGGVKQTIENLSEHFGLSGSDVVVVISRSIVRDLKYIHDTEVIYCD